MSNNNYKNDQLTSHEIKEKTLFLKIHAENSVKEIHFIFPIRQVVEF